MLVQVAMIALAMFGILSLVIDMGYVTLTRVQMQNAADAAALEGVRNRNAGADGFWSDCLRRQGVNDLVHWTFDDDLDPGSDPRNYGAGPVFGLDGGDGSDLNAYQMMAPPAATHVYKPDLRLNQTANAIEGDMVSGHFDPSLGFAEHADYTRDDFLAAAPIAPNVAITQKCGDPPPDTPNLTLLGDDNNAFLVRFRRTRETLDESGDVSSSGPALPFLFGRGTAIHGDGTTPYNPRVDGITVRATAIGRVRPALRVGLRQTGPGFLGASPFALDWTNFVAGLLVTGDATVAVDADGIIRDGSGTDVGRFVDSMVSISSVGVVPPDHLTAPLACDAYQQGGAGYGPVYADFSGTRRIIGFVRIEWSWPGCAGGITVTRPGAGLVANANATALLAEGLPSEMSAADLLALKNYLVDLNETSHVALLAPALAR
jgi:hypothetical protein